MTTTPTRIVNNAASLSDHIWSSQIDSNINNYIILVFTDISDHLPIVSCCQKCTAPTQPLAVATSGVFKRVFSFRNMRDFVSGVAQLDCGDELESGCPNAVLNLFLF